MCHKALCALCALCVLATPLWSQEARAGEEARRALARLGLDAGSYTDIETARKTLRTLGRTVTLVKAVDPRTGETVGGAVDQDGRPVDFSLLRSQEIAARRSNPDAKLDPVLAEAVRQRPADVHEVVVWLDYPSQEYDEYRRMVWSSLDVETAPADELARLEADVAAYVMSRNAEITGELVAWLRTTGMRLRYVSTTAPVVFVDATGPEVLALAARPDVDTLYLEDHDKADTNEDSNQTHRTSRAHNMGVKGDGVDVAVLENNRVDENHPWLDVTAWFDLSGSGPDDHVQGTSGCIASQHPSRLGSAPAVDLYSANADSYSDTDVTAAGDWIISQVTVDITNNSWGPTSPTGNLRYADRYFDYQVRQFQDAYVHSAGNSGIGNLVGNVGWNLLCVGAVENGGNGDWDDDGIACYSSTGDPTTGCEKPNLVAVGSGVDTLGDGTISTFGSGCSPTSTSQPAAWLIDQYNGTSFSSPHCAGNLANAMSLDLTLNTYPQAAMALMMATAWHNIEGSGRLSDQDGAGCINGLAAVRAARAQNAFGTTVTTSSFNNSGYYTYDIHLQGGDRARVCIAWSSNANSAYTTDVMDADLDLAVFTGQGQTSGTSHGFSSSFDNNFEIVEFTPPSTGWYTVRVNDFRFDGTSEPLGIAWSQKVTDGTSGRIRHYTSESSSLRGPTIGNQFHFLDLDFPNSPGDGYLCSPGSTIGPGISFSPETWTPLSFDLWTILWLDDLSTGNWFWVNSIGTLSSSGAEFSNRMKVPDLLPLAGMTTQYISYSLNPAYPDSFKETSDVHDFKFWPPPVDRTMSDDSSVQQPIPFGFNFYGTTYTECYVNANGNITFGSGDSDFTPSASEMLSDQPRVAFFWDDLHPGQSGTTSVREVFYNDQELVVEFMNVPHRNASDDNTIRTTLRQDGTVIIEFRDCDEETCLVGISPGNGISTASERDLDAEGFATSGTNQAFFEYFSSSTSDEFDLGHPGFWMNRLIFTPTSSSNTNYRLTMDVDQ